MSEIKEIIPMYIVGNIVDKKFKQAIHWGGHSGNRLFSREADAIRFFNDAKCSSREVHLYKVMAVLDCTDDIEFADKLLAEVR